jgi:hypothetical protein
MSFESLKKIFELFAENDVCGQTLNFPRTFSRLAYNVCVSSVVRFRSRALSPTQNVERRYKLWTTPHRTIEETFC